MAETTDTNVEHEEIEAPVQAAAPGDGKMPVPVPTSEDMVPGTAQIRRIAAVQTPMELLQTAAYLATHDHERKLFGVLSRVYTEHKGFHHELAEGMEPQVQAIVTSGMPAELKMQAFTSFQLPVSLRPTCEMAATWVHECAQKRLNIAAHFIAAYGYETELYRTILTNRALLKEFRESAPADAVLRFYEALIRNEDKETITGVSRMLRIGKRRFQYPQRETVQRVTDEVFASKEVFFTSKLLYCLAFTVPAACLPPQRELIKILKIAVSYEEKTVKDFVRRYHMDFDVSDAALCHYYIGNRKAEKERPIVAKLAAHLVLVEDAEERSRLLHAAFKRGGDFRLYAGCMQDGGVDVEKQRRFHYSDEQIAWVKTLPGLTREEECYHKEIDE